LLTLSVFLLHSVITSALTHFAWWSCAKFSSFPFLCRFSALRSSAADAFEEAPFETEAGSGSFAISLIVSWSELWVTWASRVRSELRGMNPWVMCTISSGRSFILDGYIVLRSASGAACVVSFVGGAVADSFVGAASLASPLIPFILFFPWSVIEDSGPPLSIATTPGIPFLDKSLDCCCAGARVHLSPHPHDLKDVTSRDCLRSRQTMDRGRSRGVSEQ
jgi:hypothetical protein